MITAHEQTETVSNFSIEKLSLNQLINLAIESHEDKVGIESKLELIKRGTDNIEIRIQIKKLIKAIIANTQEQINTENNTEIKSKFLVSLSISDKLQLEWQKKDLILKAH